MPRDTKAVAHLHWIGKDNAGNDTLVTPKCFCRSPIAFPLAGKLQATPETVAAIFGVMEPSSIKLQRKDQNIPSPLELFEGENGNLSWRLEEDVDYQVSVMNTDPSTSVIPIKEIFSNIPGDTEEEKSERLQALSNDFYDRIWNQKEGVPDEFRSKFFSVTSNVKIQAFRQFDWLYEVFGGPAFAGEAGREDHLIPKVKAKHTSSRMTLEHSITWLQLMSQSVQHVFADFPEIQLSLTLYWLHFYAFFSFSDEERKILRGVAMSVFSK